MTARLPNSALAAIVDLCGDTTDGWLAGRVQGLWDRWAGHPLDRRELLTRLDALTGLLAHAPSAAATARWTALHALTLGSLRRMPAAPAMGQLTTAAPTAPPWAGGVDANDPAYGGHPYRRSHGGDYG